MDLQEVQTCDESILSCPLDAGILVITPQSPAMLLACRGKPRLGGVGVQGVSFLEAGASTGRQDIHSAKLCTDAQRWASCDSGCVGQSKQRARQVAKIQKIETGRFEDMELLQYPGSGSKPTRIKLDHGVLCKGLCTKLLFDLMPELGGYLGVVVRALKQDGMGNLVQDWLVVGKQAAVVGYGCLHRSRRCAGVARTELEDHTGAYQERKHTRSPKPHR